MKTSSRRKMKSPQLFRVNAPGKDTLVVHIERSQGKDRRPQANTRSYRRTATSKSVAQEKQSARLAAELANLADYNAPPRARTDASSNEHEFHGRGRLESEKLSCRANQQSHRRAERSRAYHQPSDLVLCVFKLKQRSLDLGPIGQQTATANGLP